MYRVPDSSTPPSTPGRSYARENNPSTTPAAPPPLDFSAGAPAAPPPSLFSTRPNFEPGHTWNFSTINSSPPRHGVLEGIGSGSYRASTFGRPGSHRGRTSSGYRMQVSPPRAIADEEEAADEEMDAEGEDEDAEGEQDGNMRDDGGLLSMRRMRTQSQFAQSMASQTSVTDSMMGPTIVDPDAKQNVYDLLSIAKGLSPSNDSLSLHEPDKIILETEQLLEKLADSLDNDEPEKRASVLGDVAQELLHVWQASLQTSRTLASSRSGASAALSNAAKLSDLLINIHHPRPIASPQRFGAPSLALARVGANTFTPIPKVLLDWLNKYRSTAAEIDMVMKETRGYSRHQYFWDAVHASAFRGQFDKTVELLQGANFSVAYTAQIDELGDVGYDGHHRRYSEEAVRAAINLLSECPAVRADDWDIKGSDWGIFRKHTQQAYSDLMELAEGDSMNRQTVSQPFQASHFGISQSQASFHLSVASRRAESKVPWSVYESLSRLYQLLLGNEEEIVAIAADWIDATLGLAVWWDGEEEELMPQGSLAASRRSIGRSQRVRMVDVTPVKAYCERMACAFAAVLENDEEFSVNTADRLEVGVACIIDDNVEGALQILRGSSLVIASAVAQIATAGGWLVRADSDLMGNFDQSDLMVLSYTEQHQTGVSQDELLTAYSKLLTSKGQVKDGLTTREGWELAIQALGRLDDTVLANERIEKILDQLPLESAERVDKITQLCHNMGLSKQALGIALKYADHLRANTQNYGDTLLYYARAHAATKIQEVLRVLVAHCLIKSIAYPPPTELDNSLRDLISSPKQTLTKLASLDSEAAQLLSSHLSGYATIRRYYDLRDEEVLLKDGEKPILRPMARKLAAANSLMVIIQSAASSIRGGLYDPDVETVVQVDVLLPLLGEALVFVNQPKRTLTLRHLYTLLSAIEDYTTAPSMIKSQCEEALQTTLSASNASNSNSQSQSQSQPNSRQTTFGLSSTYSLIDSRDFSSAGGGLSTESSAVLVGGSNGAVDISKRGWDWRKGFEGRKAVTGEDVVRILRLGVAKELGRAFAEGEVKVLV